MTKEAEIQRLYKAVHALCLQGGTDTAETIDWLCGPRGGMAKLFAAYFSPKPTAQSFGEKYPRNPDAERIAELERESETHAKAYGLAIVERDNLRHELKTAQEGWRCECSTDDACRFARERDALRAELAEIAAAEPVMFAYEYSDGSWHDASSAEHSAGMKPLFTRPMPAQDVTELVEAVTCLLQLIRREAPDLSGKVMGFASTALSKYKGAK